MGDQKRNVVFCKFVLKQFSRAESFLVVADGKGELARLLANKGKKVRVVENKPRFRGRGHKRIKYQRGWFSSDAKIEEDVIIGMHPDEATAPIIKAAKKNKKSWAVVPCCIKGEESQGVGTYSGWLKRLCSLDKGICQTQLRMNGKNIVLFRR